MFPPLHLLLFLLVVLRLSLCMQTTAFDVRKGNSPVMEVLCIEKERQVLLNVKKGLLDPSHRLSSWVEEVNCCQWRGVKCNNKTGHVVTLDLHNPYNPYVMDNDDFIESSLGGEISSSLLDLQYLQHLDLSSNNFNSNPIPEFLGSFVQLRSLNLSYANFSGQIPHQIGNLSNLNYLDLKCFYYQPLFVNNLDWISRLGSLIYLDMSGTNLSLISDLFNNLYRLPSLKHLRLSGCGLHKISSSSYLNWGHANLISIKYIDLSDNDLSSTIFKPLGNATSLLYLDLSLNSLNCLIPSLLGQMKSLERLDLSGNQLKGHISIPSLLGQMRSLEYLDLSDNQLKGFSIGSLANLSSLSFLDFFANDLNGPIPNFLGNITSLTYLSLLGNRLEGGIPSNLGKLCNLQELDLRGNNLSGDVADEFWAGCISNSLESIDLSYNSLKGVISEPHLSRFSKLRSLDLSSNSFRLKLSFDWTPPFQLEKASLGSCRLGPRFPLWLRMQKNISYLDLSHTGISDTIPSWFWNFSSNVELMDLSSNHIYGKLPTLSLALQKKIDTIDLSSNLLNGSIPGISPSTQQLYLSNNSFSGTLSDLLCNVSSIPNSLRVLDLSGNQLAGLIPDCLKYWRGMQFLYLRKNNFSGEIPNSIGYMYYLFSIHFNGNNFSGVLPLSLKNCTSLEVFDVGENMFSGEIPPWIGENLARLSILRLHSNGFTGNIPSQLCQITSLRILDLAHNNLQGFIPRCLINITWNLNNNSMIDMSESVMVVFKNMELEYQIGQKFTLFFFKCIDLSSNSLSGEIPDEMMNLVGLLSLNLSRNNLVGKIPGNSGNLSNLESLDFSRNHLSGVLPVSMANLNFLGTLDLSFNNFSGTIPLSTQLQSFNASSYMENSGLCGPPLSANCTTNDTSSPQGHDHHSTRNEDGIDIPWFYIGMAMGYIVGFWIACGFLLFKRSWRKACFRYVEEVHDWFYVVLIVNARKLQRKFGN